MARRGYPAELRQRVVALVEGGRKVSELAAELGGSGQTVCMWRRQARIDAGLEAGITTGERAELEAAKRRIRELETELAVHRRATELLKETARPKGLRGDPSDGRGGTPRRGSVPRSGRLAVGGRRVG